MSVGLTGGVWIARLLGDLNGGLFDGAWLVQNFESLNPGHAYFGKYGALFAHPDVERERFIEFERWWGEFCFLTREEIVAIVDHLFIGNPWAAAESRLMNVWSGYFDDWRRNRDDSVEKLFAMLYGHEQSSGGGAQSSIQQRR